MNTIRFSIVFSSICLAACGGDDAVFPYGGVDVTLDGGDEDTSTDGGDDTGTDTAPDTPCDDDDNDSVCNEDDICEGYDDSIDADDDRVPDGCDICEGYDDSIDADDDRVPDGCDICEGFDDSIDLDGDGVPNLCDRCTGPDGACRFSCYTQNFIGEDGETLYGCAADSDEYFDDTSPFAPVLGVDWATRDTLCGDGYSPATALEWIAARGDTEPRYHYWTDDELLWEGEDSGSCSAGLISDGHTRGCTAGPMRVCASTEGSIIDPLGNVCTWVGCGYLTNSPNQYFGGCNVGTEVGGRMTGTTAGTLCVVDSSGP